VHDLNWTIPRPGETIAGKYVVEGLCGRGGLAAVLSAMHVGLDQRVAIKMLLPEWSDEPQVVERFLREGRAATRIRSEHVVRVFDVGTLEGGAPYLVLEYLEGHNLDDVLAMWGPLPIPTAVDWILQAAEAIAEAHSYGIVHRDLKPGNLFLTRRADGSACIKVIDFGLSKVTDPRMSSASSKLTRENDVLGSPHYMAPEQLRATRDADTPADVWALGTVLHELLTGQTPFRGETMPELCATVLTQPPPRLSSLRASIPGEIEAAVLRCLEKEPGARFANVAELARAIAPFGTAIARESCARIERVLEGGPTSDLSLPPMLFEPPARATEEWPSDAYVVPRRGSASMKVVFGGLLMLGGVGAAMFMGLYNIAHSNDSPRVGRTAMQATATATAVAPPPIGRISTPPAERAEAVATAPESASPPPPEPHPEPIGAATAPARSHATVAPKHAPPPAPASAPASTRAAASNPTRPPLPNPGVPSLATPSSPKPTSTHDDKPHTSPAPSSPSQADDLFSGRK
jgi:serine/threonine-protein kinase